MLHSVQLPNHPLLELASGVHFLGADGLLVRAATGYALFDTGSHLLPRAGLVEVQLSAPLDGRHYTIRRALDEPEHWQVQDQDTGWLAASGAVDAERWLHSNLAVPDELPLARLFHDAVSFSIPVTLAFLMEEAGLRERVFAQLLRTERYPSGLRWLDSVLIQAAAATRPIELQARDRAGQDSLFDEIRRRYEQARAGCLEADEGAAALRLLLGEAQTRRERLAGLESELAEVQRDIQVRRLLLPGLEAQLDRWRHWLGIRDRAKRNMAEHEPEYKTFQAASAEITKLRSRLTGIDALRSELLAGMADLLALQREQALIEEDVARLRQADQTANDLAEPVHQQQQLEQQLTLTHERALRLDQANRGLQSALADTKRIGVLVAEVERQIADVEPLSGQGAQVKRLESELERQQAQLRELGRHVDQLHFLEAAIRIVGVQLDELRKGASITERLVVKSSAGNGAQSSERTLTSHLREAVDNQMRALERQLREWQTQARDLAAAPQQVNQVRANLHQLEQELGAARKLELRFGAVSALRLHDKHLRERQDQLKRVAEAHIKEQQECADAPAQLGQIRQDLAALNDPRSERAALLKVAARKDVVEGELRQVQRRLEDRQAQQKQVERQLAALDELGSAIEEQQRRRDEAHDGCCAYLSQQAIVELAQPAEEELEAARSANEAQRHIQEQALARASGLQASINELQTSVTEVAALEAQLAEAEIRAADWKARYQLAAEAQAAAEQNRSAFNESQRELALHMRAQALLEETRSTVQEADAILGSRLRQHIAGAATTYLRLLLEEPEAEFTWAWAGAPVLVRSDSSHPLDELGVIDQACCALAFRLALAGDASRLRTVFISGLGSPPDPGQFARRLERLPDFDQFLLPAGW